MDRNQIISAILSILSLVVSILAYINSLNSKKISQGQIELQIHQHIAESENNLLNILMKKNEFTDTYFNNILDVALQFNLNAYEEACAKYIDNKVDKKRFKKNYQAPITSIVKEPMYNKFFNPNTSNYRAILKVNQEWNNLEK